MVNLSKLDKLYYSIGEVAEMFGVSKSLVRYWENEFSFLTPRKNKKGDRRFTPENIQQLQIIFDLVKVRGFTLEGAKQEIRQEKSRLQSRQKAIERLQNLRERMQTTRESLDQHIGNPNQD